MAETPAVGYFVDQKKGEVNELKLLLKNINVERDNKRKREIIKKVIAYMTLGIDVSRLFTDMIMAIETKDIVVKKMVYLYLCNYAVKEPELAIMCINTLRRDCDNEDPLVRGLALRSLCNLRLESILEYIEQPLQKSLRDLSAYVRKTGVMAILKVKTVHKISPSLVESNRYLEQLYSMLQDLDANVITNVIRAIDELQITNGGIEVNQSTVMNLLNRIGEFSEWGLNTILELVARYKPASEDEIFAIMNLLDPVLRTANSGAVLATFKCFMKLTANLKHLHPQIYLRSKPPLLTLITGSHSELQFVMLKHLELILIEPEAKGIFDDEYRQFFVRYNEPPHVKHLKVDLLPLITNDRNAKDIATELGEYVTDVDAELSKRAIRAIGEIAIKIQLVSVEMTQILMELIYMEVSYIRAEAAKIVSNVIRAAPNISGLVLPHLSRLLKKCDDEDAKASLIWMLGEFGEAIVEAPYMLEPIIDNIYADEQSSVVIKLQILTTALKLFFKRPPEMQAMLGRLLRLAINDSSNQDLHDRALLYYRLLTVDLQAAKGLFSGNKACAIVDGNFAEAIDKLKNDKLFNEFNSLAIVYGVPSVQFICEENQLKLENAPIPDFDFSSSTAHTVLLGNNNNNNNSIVENVQQQQQQLNNSTQNNNTKHHNNNHAVVGSVNLLDWDDYDTTTTTTSAVASSFAPPPPPLKNKIILVDNSNSTYGVVTPAKFQEMWTSFPEVFNGKVCNLNRSPAAANELEVALRAEKILTIASGSLPPNSNQQGFKLFLYGIEENLTLTSNSKNFFLLQLILYSSSLEVNIVLKTDSKNSSDPSLFLEYLYSSLKTFMK